MITLDELLKNKLPEEKELLLAHIGRCVKDAWLATNEDFRIQEEINDLMLQENNEEEK